jgi:predicted butyrate kinase (DUF1464 family)
MVRALGIDPGTRSFDVCGLDDGRVYFEKVIDTVKLVEGPEPMMQAIEEARPLDLITGPSGYGVEVTYLEDIDNPGEFMRTILLLLRKDDYEAALARRDLGIMVYAAMIKLEVEMKRGELPVCYIPGVIQLPTVPLHRKVNKIDMGTVDKACAAVLGVHDQAERLKIPYSETSFILIESGFGYNAVIGVEGGRIVDGIGGTIGGPGFLTLGGMDAELAAIVGRWEKADIFTGGGVSISGRGSLEEIGDHLDEEDCRVAWEAIIEGVEKGVASMTVSVPRAREILLSGRWARTARLREELTRRLSRFGPVRRVGWLESAIVVKEAAQGYAMVADGLAGGEYAELIEWMRIKEAKGTALDYVYHRKGRGALQELAPWFKPAT